MSDLGLVIPAAGLGTRLRPYSETCSKEMLVVAGSRLVDHALAEAANAGIDDVVVVVHPRKVDLVAHLEARGVRLVAQPEPVGVLDAVARGREALGGGPVAILYPDYTLRPDPVGLATLARAWRRTGGWMYAVVRGDETPRGRTVKVRTQAHAGHHRVLEVDEACVPAAGALHTVFAEIRPTPLPTADDRDLLTHLRAAASAGTLFAAELPGTLYDVGTRAGYEYALRQLGGPG